MLYVCVVMSVNQTYCGDDFKIHANTDSLRCMPETNIRVYVDYVSKKEDVVFKKFRYFKMEQTQGSTP